MTHYAHTLPPPATRQQWEPLAEHLRRVAGDDPALPPGAADFADAFGAAEWGHLLGLWHDLGKYSGAFQARLGKLGDPHRMEVVERVDHSTAGAQHAVKRGPLGRLLAYAVAGHHGGLPDDDAGEAGLTLRLKKQIAPYADAPPALLDRSLPGLPALARRDAKRQLSFSLAFFTRMLFSCLVDADFLATEAFMSPDRAADRPDAATPTPADLMVRLDAHLDAKTADADPTPVNRQRATVLAACRDKAALPPGFFSLNVPTGGGKTLSSLAFALRHAALHGLRRVVYAVPFTSIIEQTAEVFRDRVGLPGVLEVHSNLDPDDPDRASQRTRLAAENFDAPLVVTTNVQLLESLFAAGTSRCRKLHRLARSVLIFDEAQTLPPALLAPTLWALDELVRNYGCTVVLCTATQPAVERRDGFEIGLENVRPIIDDEAGLHAALRRTRVEVAGVLDDDELAARLSAEPQALCVVNNRKHARAIFERVNDDGEALHLSANLCAAHRSKIVKRIRERLEAGRRCRVVSTAVIEAGVDVDFPAVYRAAAGLDSIAQAAGRCNREGRLAVGRVVVFDYDEKQHRPPPFVKDAAAKFREVLGAHRDDLLSPAAVEAYFRLFYWHQGGDDGRGWDRGKERLSVLDCFGDEPGQMHFQFRAAAERYRLIEDAQTPVLVPWKRGDALRRELEDMPDDVDPARLRGWDRRAQRYVVSVFDHELRRLRENTILGERFGRLYLNRHDAYDEQLGLRAELEGMDADVLTSV